jgi:hypothetical protein
MGIYELDGWDNKGGVAGRDRDCRLDGAAWRGSLLVSAEEEDDLDMADGSIWSGKMYIGGVGVYGWVEEGP